MLATALFATGLLVGHHAPVRGCGRAAARMGLHDLTAKAMDGSELALASLAGKNVIALNVASR